MIKVNTPDPEGIHYAVVVLLPDGTTYEVPASGLKAALAIGYQECEAWKDEVAEVCVIWQQGKAGITGYLTKKGEHTQTKTNWNV